MAEYLVLSAIGTDRPGLVDELSEAIMGCECNIVDSRMTILGGEFAIIMMVSGNWNCIARLESQLPGLQEKLGMTITSKRTESPPVRPNLMPYFVEAVAIDHPGVVYQLASFFSSRDINIEDLQTQTYAAAHTGTPMFAVAMTVSIPGDMRIAELRDEFMDFCDEFNLDATLEPSKN